MADTFHQLLQLLNNGEPVDAATTNRVGTQLQSNVLFLKALIDGLELGTSVIMRDQVLASDVQVGQPVYFKLSANRFEKALGLVDQDPTTKLYVMADSAMVWGLVSEKSTATTGDILLHGVAELDLAAAVSGAVEAGLYYLSNGVAGRLQKQRPPVGVTVAQVAQETTGGKRVVYVNTKFDDLRSAHAHYNFTLSALPAGTHNPPAGSAEHVITSPDAGVEGWLPASHASFGGLAPANAKFGYNIAQSGFANVWPPSPITSVYLELSRGEYTAGLGTGVPLGAEQLCVIDRNGIWWMSACQGAVPWPDDYDSDNGAIVTDVDDCPRRAMPLLVLWFTRPVFTSDATAVTSLQAEAGSPISVVCVDDGTPQTTGNLLLKFNLSQGSEDADLTVGKAVKILDGDVFKTGPVVSALKVTGSSLILTSNEAARTDGSRTGLLNLGFDVDLNGREVGVDLIKLDGAEEYPYEDLLTWAFFQGRLSAVRMRIVLPTAFDFPAGTQLKLRLTFANLTADPFPAELFSLTYRRITQPATPGAVLSLPLSGAEVALADLPAVPIGGAAANEYFFVESEAIDIAAGDIILFRLTRHGNTDGFAGTVLMLRQAGFYAVP